MPYTVAGSPELAIQCQRAGRRSQAKLQERKTPNLEIAEAGAGRGSCQLLHLWGAPRGSRGS